VATPGSESKSPALTRPPAKARSSTRPRAIDFGPIFSTAEPSVNQFTLLNVEGSVLVIWTTDFPGTTRFEVDGGASPDPQAHVDDQVQLRGIVDSIVVTPH
jgi:hypothetical protein